MLSRKEQELRIFEALAPLAGFTVAPGSISQPPPPSPDIECRLADGSMLSAELVSTDADQTHTRLNNMRSTRACWDEALSSWPSLDRRRLQEIGMSSHISLVGLETYGRRQLSALMKQVQEVLLAGQLTGHDLLPLLPLHAELISAKVFPNPLRDGLHLTAPSAGRLIEPNYLKIEQKLRVKRYKTMSPLYLFAYAFHDDITAFIGSETRLAGICDAYLALSAFEGACFFNLHYLEHVFTKRRT